ncbi:MAG TPA: MBL fold metallo-hydrolase [Firmicutes bacterium]|nr:MBL fold metallo-hydrolase [Bacillota bacterium]
MQDMEFGSVVSLRLPTPYVAGPVNCYLVKGETTTLVDTGPPTEEAWAALLRYLDETGAAGRLPQVVVTHSHLEHFGLYERLRSRFGSRVLAGERAARWLRPGAGEEWQAFLGALLPVAGVPADAHRHLKRMGFGLSSHQVGEPPDGWLVPGQDIVMGDDRWRVLATPGHSSCSVSFLRETDGCLLGGDSLLLDTYSHSLLEPDPEASDGGARFVGASASGTSVAGTSAAGAPAESVAWYRSLNDYLLTLEQLRDMAISRVLPGHGEPIANPAAFLASRLRYLRSRQETVYGLLQEGDKTPYQVCLGLFPHLGWTDLLPALTETIGYLDLLETGGRAGKDEAGGKLYFHAR